MEIKCTLIVRATADDKYRFSASVAEIGAGAGRKTWQNALDYVEGTEDDGEAFALSLDELAALRDDVAGFGAWDREAIDAWTPEECAALFTQLVAGDYRNLCRHLEDIGADPENFSDEEFQEATEREGGSLYRGDDGEWYYDAGL